MPASGKRHFPRGDLGGIGEIGGSIDGFEIEKPGRQFRDD